MAAPTATLNQSVSANYNENAPESGHEENRRREFEQIALRVLAASKGNPRHTQEQYLNAKDVLAISSFEFLSHNST